MKFSLSLFQRIIFALLLLASSKSFSQNTYNSIVNGTIGVNFSNPPYSNSQLKQSGGTIYNVNFNHIISSPTALIMTTSSLGKLNVFINKNLTVTGNFTSQNAAIEINGSVFTINGEYLSSNVTSIVVKNGGKLVVTRNMDYKGLLTIESGAEVQVGGSFTLGNIAASTININGTLSVGGDLLPLNSGNSTWNIGSTGNLIVGGNFNNSNVHTSFNVSGNVSVDGNVDYSKGNVTINTGATFTSTGSTLNLGTTALVNNGAMYFPNVVPPTTNNIPITCTTVIGIGSITYANSLGCGIPDSVLSFQSGSISSVSTWLNNFLPIATKIAYVKAGHIISLTKNETINYPLTFRTGSTLDLNGFTLSTSSDIIFEGSASLIHDNGKIIYNKLGNQSVEKANYYNLELTGSGIKSLNGATKVEHELQISSILTFNTNDNLTLSSNASYTARLLAIPTGAVVNGKLKMERFIPANHRTWWQLSSSYSDATVSQYQQFFPVTGPFVGADLLEGSNNTSLQYYNETNPNPDYSIGWTPFPSANSSETFAPGKGYRAFLRASKTAPIGDLTVSVLGSPNIGDVSLPVTFTTSSGVDADGWSFVGNPYPCDIDWDAATWVKTNVANAI